MGIGSFLDALAFLSVLAPASDASGKKFAAAIVWFGPAGALLGAICSICAFAFLSSLIAYSSASPELIALGGGWLWISLEVFLSRGLHWDGVADLGDGLGSGAVGDKFWQIAKDSRLGAYGATTLFLLLTGNAILAGTRLSGALEGRAAFSLILLSMAPAWGRMTPALLAARQGASPESGLGRLFCDNLSSGALIGTVLFGIAILALARFCGVSWLGLACLVVAETALILGLAKIASSRGGLSGDFFGAAIECSQTLFLFFALFQ